MVEGSLLAASAVTGLDVAAVDHELVWFTALAIRLFDEQNVGVAFADRAETPTAATGEERATGGRSRPAEPPST